MVAFLESVHACQPSCLASKPSYKTLQRPSSGYRGEHFCTPLSCCLLSHADKSMAIYIFLCDREGSAGDRYIAVCYNCKKKWARGAWLDVVAVSKAANRRWMLRGWLLIIADAVRQDVWSATEATRMKDTLLLLRLAVEARWRTCSSQMV